MQTLTIDIINDKAIKLLQEMEALGLIKIHEKRSVSGNLNDIRKLMGSMTKQPIEEIEAHLKELRDAWE
jgi:hypothetical protein